MTKSSSIYWPVSIVNLAWPSETPLISFPLILGTQNACYVIHCFSATSLLMACVCKTNRSIRIISSSQVSCSFTRKFLLRHYLISKDRMTSYSQCVCCCQIWHYATIQFLQCVSWQMVIRWSAIFDTDNGIITARHWFILLWATFVICI